MCEQENLKRTNGMRKQEAKAKAFKAMEGDDVESNDKGEVALHGRTYSYWTTAVPSEPIKQLD